MGLFDKLRNKKTLGMKEATIPTEVQQEIESALHFCIYSGFYTQDDMLAYAHDTFEDICKYNNVAIVSNSLIKQTTERLIANANLIAIDSNNFARLRSVFDALNREHIIAIHFAGYTLDDGFDEVGTVFQFMKENDIPRRGYCFYHQQDIERAMDKSKNWLKLVTHYTLKHLT